MSPIYTKHPANIAGEQLDCITQADVDPGVLFNRPLVDGETMPHAVFKLQERGIFPIASYDIAGALDLLSDSFSASGASDVFSVPLTAAGGKTTASAVKHAMANSLAHWATITANAQQLAVISMQVHAYGSSGIVKTDSQTATSHTPGSDQGFMLHSVSVNGTAITDIQGVTITSGVTVAKTPQEGSILPGNVVINGKMPMVTFRTLKENALLVETALNGTSGVVVVLGKLSDTGGGFVSGANHVELTFANGAIKGGRTSSDPRVTEFEAHIISAIAIDTSHSLS